LSYLLVDVEGFASRTPTRTSLLMSVGGKKCVVITGATGLIGTELCKRLTDKGVLVRRLTTRKVETEGDFSWNPSKGTIDADAFQGADAVIHLAGENIASNTLDNPLGLWTDAKKKRILDSRVEGTKLLVSTMKSLKSPPKVFIASSGIGFYGYKDSTTVFDESPSKLYYKGDGFLADVCDKWEAEAMRYSVGRTVIARTAVVLSKKGGLLAKLAPLFNLGGGGVIGSGEQALTWIAIDDIVSAFEFMLDSRSVSGPINLCAPNPVTNKEFTQALGR
jgi:uncharacterized protein